MSDQPFSARHNYVQPRPIAIRDDAPVVVRHAVIDEARQLGYSAEYLLKVVHSMLKIKPWREYSSFSDGWQEMECRVAICDWFLVYDIIEGVYSLMVRHDTDLGTRYAFQYATEINRVFNEEGVGWKLEEGRVVMRGDEAFELILTRAEPALADSGRPTAAHEIHEALAALSRRPQPNILAAARHAVAALECVARDVTGDASATLGEIVKKHRDIVPKPLDQALEKIWGYASNDVRHGRENPDIALDEAELLVGLCASLCTYLARLPKKAAS